MAWLFHTPLHKSLPCGGQSGPFSIMYRILRLLPMQYISQKILPKPYACARGSNHVAETTAQTKARLVCTEYVGWLSSAQRCRTKRWPLCCCRCCWSLLQLHPSCPQQRRSPLGFLLPFPQGSPNPLQETNTFYIRCGSQKWVSKQWNHFIDTPFFPTTSYTHPHLARHTARAVANPEPLAGWLDACWMPPNRRNERLLSIFYSAAAQFSLSFM